MRERLHLRESDLPPTARNLVRLAGWRGALALVREMPGARIYSPAERMSREADARFERVAELAGRDAAQRIYDEYHGSLVEIPNCRAAITAARDRHIRTRFDAAGATVEDLCAETGLSRRQIFYILKIADEPGATRAADVRGQMGLF